MDLSSNSVVYYGYQFLIWFIPCIVLSWFIKLFTYNKSSTSLRHPPSPPSIPIIGHIYLLNSKLPKCFQSLAKKYGPLMKIKIGASTFIVASNASFAKEIFKTHDLDLSSRFVFGPEEYTIYSDQDGFITGSYGTYWRLMKKLCMTKLFVGSQLDRFNSLREQEIVNFLKSIMKYAERREPCDLGVEFGNLMNILFCRMTMSKRFSNKDNNEAKEMRRLLMEIFQVAAELGINQVFGPLKKVDLFGKGKKLKDVLRQYDQMLEQIIKEYEGNGLTSYEKEEDKDLMCILLETYNDTNAEVKLTRDKIKVFFMELFMASMDTSAAALQWAMAELIMHPQVLKNLREEIDSTVGSSRLVKESDVPKLHYLQAVVKETLRLHTPAPIIHRECINDCNINGYDIKAGFRFLINVYAIMRDPTTWENPDEFMPERFLNNHNRESIDLSQVEMKNMNYSYIPFGGGRRSCIGEKHANMVMHATIGALVQCFDWKLGNGDHEKVDLDVGEGYTGAMARPLVCYPITRFDPFP